MPLSTAQIGRSGELLVQYRLLLLGVEPTPGKVRVMRKPWLV
jgi:hypothetical protein